MHYANASRPVRRMISILSLVLISTCSTGALSTCGGGPGRSAEVLPRDLPPLPAWAAPVTPKRPPDGTPKLEVAKIIDNANQANAGRLWCLGAWYQERREDFAGGPTKAYPASCPDGGGD